MTSKIIEKLLQGAEVEWKPLGEVAAYEQSSKYLVKTSNYNNNFNTPVLTAGKTFILGFTNEIEGIYKASISPVIIFDDFTTANKWVDFDFKAKSSAMKMITSMDDKRYILKYIYYWLNTLPNEQSDNDHKRQWIGSYSKKLIPIPPLSVQEEIVRILDAFAGYTAKLTAELTAELTQRQKQYNYYRDTLLTFQDGEAEWKTLGEVGQLIRGNGLQKKDFTEKGVPAIHYGQIYTFYKTFTTETKSFVSNELAKTLKKVDTGDVVITNTSENLDDVGKALVYLGKEQAVTGGHATIFKPNSNILGKYFAYFTQTIFFANQKRKYAKGTKVIDVSAADMSKIIIPIPPLAEQQCIVDILDKFDALTTSITQDLPREIGLRQMQYEYYREQILDFSKPELDA